jgi:uncharacterized protein (TIGR03437 family)
MKTVVAMIASLGLWTAAALAQPTITQVSNAASQSLSVPGPDAAAEGASGWLTLPYGSIAQGSYFTIYGNGFGGNTSLWNPYPLPTELNGTTVSITVGQNSPVAAYIEFAAQLTGYSQVNAVLPSGTPTGAGTVTVTYNGQTSAPAPINVVASAFGTFTQNLAGDGPGTITDAFYIQLSPFHTAKPGQTMILWGTGLGPATNIATEATGYPAQVNLCATAATCPVTVWVGGQQATVAYAGSSGYTAEDQIDFVVPTNVTTGCYVSVAVQSGAPGGPQAISNFTTMAVDPNGVTCRDADGVNMNDFTTALQSKGAANVAVIGLLGDTWNINLDAQGLFVQWEGDTVDGRIGTFDTAALELFRGFTRVPSANSCTAIPYRGYLPTVDYGLNYVTYLDAGPDLSIQGPLGSQQIAKTANGYVGLVGGAATDDLVSGDGTAPFYWNSTATPNGDGTTSYSNTSIASGNYTVSGPGGAAVNAFTSTVDISSAAATFNWTNASNFNGQTAPVINRATPLNITWSGGDPQGFVDITLIGSTVQNSYPSATNPEPAMAVECVVPTGATGSGSFNVPTYVLQALPPAVNSGSFVSGVVLVGQTSAVTPINPAPTGLDAAYLYYRIISGYTVDWQ